MSNNQDTDDALIQVICPSDKSLTHRAFMFSALAKGESCINNPLWGDDCMSTLAAMEALGCQVERDEEHNKIVLKSEGREGLRSPEKPLDFGNSGTTARLMLGFLAPLVQIKANICGDESLSSRPMSRVVNLLREMGADISGPDNGETLPLTIKGKKLTGKNLTYKKASAQVKSAVLLAGLSTEGQTSITLPVGSRDHTELLLEKLEIPIKIEKKADKETVRVSKIETIQALGDISVPGDPSSAAFFVSHCLLAGKSPRLIKGVLKNCTRTGFVEVLQSMGAKLTWQKSQDGTKYLEEAQDLLLSPSEGLKATKVSASQIPSLIDEIPILAVVASFAEGVTEFESVAELRVKESDRLEKTIELLTLAGKKAWSEGDSLFVEGSKVFNGGFVYDPSYDHRMAMSAAILTHKQDPCDIKDLECISVSMPKFFDLLASLG